MAGKEKAKDGKITKKTSGTVNEFAGKDLPIEGTKGENESEVRSQESGAETKPDPSPKPESEEPAHETEPEPEKPAHETEPEPEKPAHETEPEPEKPSPKPEPEPAKDVINDLKPDPPPELTTVRGEDALKILREKGMRI